VEGLFTAFGALIRALRKNSLRSVAQLEPAFSSTSILERSGRRRRRLFFFWPPFFEARESHFFRERFGVIFPEQPSSRRRDESAGAPAQSGTEAMLQRLALCRAKPSPFLHKTGTEWRDA
jgi:hypothetical protein